MKANIQTNKNDGWKIKKFFEQQKEMKICREKLRKMKTTNQGSPPAKRSYRKRKWRG